MPHCNDFIEALRQPVNESTLRSIGTPTLGAEPRFGAYRGNVIAPAQKYTPIKLLDNEVITPTPNPYITIHTPTYKTPFLIPFYLLSIIPLYSPSTLPFFSLSFFTANPSIINFAGAAPASQSSLLNSSRLIYVVM